jgi:hypothetical protein
MYRELTEGRSQPVIFEAFNTTLVVILAYLKTVLLAPDQL